MIKIFVDICMLVIERDLDKCVNKLVIESVIEIERY